ncbi:MAG: TolC family protein [Oligoflexia bacterium]|nr:TolC family protein [Oligoflexia bacterium]
MASEPAESAYCLALASAHENPRLVPRGILSCVLENHPELRSSRLVQKQAAAQVGYAGQRPNPELDGRVGLAALGGQEAANALEVSLLHRWELGGRRSARVARAQAELNLAAADVRKREETAAVQTLLALHRLRQLEEEKAILADTVTTFEKQLAALGGRPALTPEQQVSHSIFVLAKEEAELREASLLAEKERLIRRLQFWMGSAMPYSHAWLPSEPSRWPELATGSPAQAEPAALRGAAAVSGLAQAELGLARAEAWPDLKFGPFLERTDAVSGRAYSLGIQLSLTLPVFNQNGGGRAAAQAGVDRAESDAGIARAERESERSSAVAQYQKMVGRLGQSRWKRESGGRQETLERLFARGLISIPLVIEAHRQLLELQKTFHELELQALEAIYQIQVLDGKLPEAFL